MNTQPTPTRYFEIRMVKEGQNFFVLERTTHGLIYKDLTADEVQPLVNILHTNDKNISLTLDEPSRLALWASNQDGSVEMEEQG